MSRAKKQRQMEKKLEQLALAGALLPATTPPPPSRPLAELLTPELLAQFVAAQVGELPAGVVAKPTQYQLFSDGLYKTITIPMGIVRVQTAKWDDKSLPAKPKGFTEGFQLTVSKIPSVLLFQVTAFFKAVHELHNAEAFVSFFLTPDNEYVVHVPKQRISGASVHHTQDREIAGELHIAEAHSHNTMSAFYSGTDDADEYNKGQRCYGVMGLITQTVPESKWRVRAGDTFYPITIGQLFSFDDYSVEHTVNGSDLFTMQGSKDGVTQQSMKVEWNPCEGVTFPDEWLQQIDKTEIVTGRYMPAPSGLSYSDTKEWVEFLQAKNGQPSDHRSWWENEARRHLEDRAVGKEPGSEDLRLWNSLPPKVGTIIDTPSNPSPADKIMCVDRGYGRYFAEE